MNLARFPSTRLGLVNGGGKVDHMGGSIVGLRRTSTTQWYVLTPPATRLCRSLICWKQRPINIKRDDALLHLLARHYHGVRCLRSGIRNARTDWQ